MGTLDNTAIGARMTDTADIDATATINSIACEPTICSCSYTATSQDCGLRAANDTGSFPVAQITMNGVPLDCATAGDMTGRFRRLELEGPGDPLSTAGNAPSVGTAALSRPTRVWIASRDTGTRNNLVARLGPAPDLHLAGTCAKDIDCLADCLLRAQPDVLLFDSASFPSGDLGDLQQICVRMPDLRVLLLVDRISSALVDDVLRNRLHGYLHSGCSMDVCIRAIDTVTRGELWVPRALLARALEAALERIAEHEQAGEEPGTAAKGMDVCTERERQILQLVRIGHTNKQIARQLGIMEDTVKKHLQHVYDKLGVRRRALLMLGEGRGSPPG